MFFARKLVIVLSASTAAVTFVLSLVDLGRNTPNYLGNAIYGLIVSAAMIALAANVRRFAKAERVFHFAYWTILAAFWILYLIEVLHSKVDLMPNDAIELAMTVLWITSLAVLILVIVWKIKNRAAEGILFAALSAGFQTAFFIAYDTIVYKWNYEFAWYWGLCWIFLGFYLYDSFGKTPMFGGTAKGE